MYNTELLQYIRMLTTQIHQLNSRLRIMALEEHEQLWEDEDIEMIFNMLSPVISHAIDEIDILIEDGGEYEMLQKLEEYNEYEE